MRVLIECLVRRETFKMFLNSFTKLAIKEGCYKYNFKLTIKCFYNLKLRCFQFKYNSLFLLHGNRK